MTEVSVINIISVLYTSMLTKLSCATMLDIVHLHAHELTHGAGSLVLVPTTCEEVGIRCSELLQVSVLSCALSGTCWVLAQLCGRAGDGQMRRNKLRFCFPDG